MKRFLLRVALFGFVQLVILFLACNPRMPGELNYLARTIEKNDRLRQIKSPRLILIGGSNVAFGFVSTNLEQELKMPVVNMGLAAGLGVPFMLKEVEDQIGPGDVVLLSFEWDIGRGGRDAHMVKQILQVRPASVPYIRWSDWKREVFDGGFLWLGGFFRRSLRPLNYHAPVPDGEYRRDWFDKANCYIGRYHKRSKFTPETPKFGTLISPISDSVLELLTEFSVHCEKAGAHCFYSCPPQPNDPAMFNLSEAEGVVAQIRGVRGIRVIDKPMEQTQSWSRFYDTSYHLTEEGAIHRTALVIGRLKPFLGK